VIHLDLIFSKRCSNYIMQRSSALQNLEVILYEAFNRGNKDAPGALVLLAAMNLETRPENLVNFYELLNKAIEEARLIKNQRRLEDHLQTLNELYALFISEHLWTQPWVVFTKKNALKNALTTLDALSNYFHLQKPTKFLEQDFLDSLNVQLAEILADIVKSDDLSRELKNFLSISIEDIISAIRKYYIAGTEGLKKSVNSVVADLMVRDFNLDEKGRSNAKYRRIKSCLFGLLFFITPTPYDIIGAAPDIQDFWMPKFGELVKKQDKVEKIMLLTPNLGVAEVLKEASKLSDGNGNIQKSLPPANKLQKTISPAKIPKKPRASVKNKPKTNSISVAGEIIDVEVVGKPQELPSTQSPQSLVGGKTQKALPPVLAE
jgi:hypothetical protein